MKASFNGARKNLARSFNRMAETNLDEHQREEMIHLRQSVAALLCMYDPDNSKDCDELIDSVYLAEIEE